MVDYSCPSAEVTLDNPALLVSVLLITWSVWLDSIEWFIKRLVSTFQKISVQNTYHTPVSNLA